METRDGSIQDMSAVVALNSHATICGPKSAALYTVPDQLAS